MVKRLPRLCCVGVVGLDNFCARGTGWAHSAERFFFSSSPSQCSWRMKSPCSCIRERGVGLKQGVTCLLNMDGVDYDNDTLTVSRTCVVIRSARAMNVGCCVSQRVNVVLYLVLQSAATRQYQFSQMQTSGIAADVKKHHHSFSCRLASHRVRNMQQQLFISHPTHATLLSHTAHLSQRTHPETRGGDSSRATAQPTSHVPRARG